MSILPWSPTATRAIMPAPAAFGPVLIEPAPPGVLRVRPDGTDPARRGVEQLARRGRHRLRADVPPVEEGPQRGAVHRVHALVEQAGPVQLAQDGGDAAGPV